MDVIAHREANACCWMTELQSFHGDAVRGPDKPEVQTRAGCWSELLESADGSVKLAGRPGRWFLHQDPRHNWSWNIQEKRALTKVAGVQVTTTKQFGTFSTDCNPSVEELSARQRSRSSIDQFRSVCSSRVDARPWRKSLEQMARWKLYRRWKRSVRRRRLRVRIGEAHYDEPTGWPKLAGDAAKEEFAFMGRL